MLWTAHVQWSKRGVVGCLRHRNSVTARVVGVRLLKPVVPGAISLHKLETLDRVAAATASALQNGRHARRNPLALVFVSVFGVFLSTIEQRLQPLTKRKPIGLGLINNTNGWDFLSQLWRLAAWILSTIYDIVVACSKSLTSMSYRHTLADPEIFKGGGVLRQRISPVVYFIASVAYIMLATLGLV